jgi:hypothetical protein
MMYVSIIRSIPLARAKLVGAVAAVVLGSSVAFSLSPPSSPPSRVANDVKSLDTRVAVPRTATMRIVPAPVIDPDAEVFIGTGDGSNGSWVRPRSETRQIGR